MVRVGMVQPQQMRYNQEVQDNIDNMEANLYRVGIDENGYIYVAYFDAGRSNQFIVTARRNLVTPASDYALVVKLEQQCYYRRRSNTVCY